MTVKAGNISVTYNGDGSTTEFPVPFKYIDKDHVIVTLRDANDTEIPWTRGSEYTLTIEGVASGGTLTVETVPIDYTPQSGETLLIALEVPNEQNKALPLGGRFPSIEVEEGLDLVTQQAADNRNRFNRSIRVPATDSVTGDDLQLPIDVDRANLYLACDASGRIIAVEGPVTGTAVSSVMIPVVSANTLANARTEMEVPGDDDDNTLTGNNTFSGTSTFSGAATFNQNFLVDKASGVVELRTRTNAVTTFPVEWYMAAHNSSGADIDYVNFTGEILVSTAGSEEGRLSINIPDGSGTKTVFRLARGVIVPNHTTLPTGGDKGAGWINVREGVALNDEEYTRGWTYETRLAATGGALFTGLPDDTREIILTFDGVGTNSTNSFLIRIGPVGGVATTGYTSGSTETSGASANSQGRSGGFIVNNRGENTNGIMHLVLAEASSNTWIESHSTAAGNGDSVYGGGRVALSGALERVELLADAGSLDAGTIGLAHRN